MIINQKTEMSISVLSIGALEGQEGVSHVSAIPKSASWRSVPLRPSADGLTYSTQRDSWVKPGKMLQRKYRPVAKRSVFSLEGQLGLEPRTPCLRGRCSNQLSYWPVVIMECACSTLPKSCVCNVVRALVLYYFTLRQLADRTGS
jgi:hypothetical protein